MSKKGYDPTIGSIAAIGILVIAFVGLQLLKTPGPEVSCQNQEITGFGVPSRPLSAVAGTHCEVEVTVSYSGSEICSNRGAIVGKDMSAVSCEGVGEYKGKELNVEATFYEGNEKVGSDSKNLVFES